MQGGAGVHVVQVDVQDALDAAQPLIEGGAGQVGALGGDRLVAAGLQVQRQDAGQVAAELEALSAAGAVVVRLGRTVLRSSSAGPAALAVLSATDRWR